MHQHARDRPDKGHADGETQMLHAVCCLACYFGSVVLDQGDLQLLVVDQHVHLRLQCCNLESLNLQGFTLVQCGSWRFLDFGKHAQNRLLR